MKYQVGDIVLIGQFKYPDGKEGTVHSFVIVDIDKDEMEILPFEYLCFLISSKDKAHYRYNEPLKKDSINRLRDDSHVKCDYLYTGVKDEDIIMLIGKVTEEQLEIFIKLYNSYIESQD